MISNPFYQGIATTIGTTLTLFATYWMFKETIDNFFVNSYIVTTYILFVLLFGLLFTILKRDIVTTRGQKAQIETLSNTLNEAKQNEAKAMQESVEIQHHLSNAIKTYWIEWHRVQYILSQAKSTDIESIEVYKKNIADLLGYAAELMDAACLNSFSANIKLWNKNAKSVQAKFRAPSAIELQRIAAKEIEPRELIEQFTISKNIDPQALKAFANLSKNANKRYNSCYNSILEGNHQYWIGCSLSQMEENNKYFSNSKNYHFYYDHVAVFSIHNPVQNHSAASCLGLLIFDTHKTPFHTGIAMEIGTMLALSFYPILEKYQSLDQPTKKVAQR